MHNASTVQTSAHAVALAHRGARPPRRADATTSPISLYCLTQWKTACLR